MLVERSRKANLGANGKYLTNTTFDSRRIGHNIYLFESSKSISI